jgi:excisionase family DNA binding protein
VGDLTLPVIMTEQEIAETNEAAFQSEQDWLDKLQQPKERSRKIEPRTLRYREAAAYLGIREWKLRAMVFAGEIEVIRHNSWLFSIDDLDRWIRKNREKK